MAHLPTLASGLMPLDVVVYGFAGRIADSEEEVVVLCVREIRSHRGDLVEISTTVGVERVPACRLFLIRD